MPVSADWFNALVARMFFNTYHERSFRKALVGLIQKKIDKVKKPSIVVRGKTRSLFLLLTLVFHYINRARLKYRK